MSNRPSTRMVSKGISAHATPCHPTKPETKSSVQRTAARLNEKWGFHVFGNSMDIARKVSASALPQQESPNDLPF